MYAVVQTGGKQYRVSPGEKIRVETLPGEVGSTVELSYVVAVMTDDAQLRTGAEVQGASVSATITRAGRGDKVIVFKFKRKKQYKRTIGHRQNYTELQVNEIRG